MRASPLPTAVQAAGIGRYSPEVEVTVYFCCLEALQNVRKHAEIEAQLASGGLED